MSTTSTVRRSTGDHRRAVAERNFVAICKAAEHLLNRGAAVSIAAVASESQLSRVTVYEHFATRQQLLEAVLDRSIRATTEAFEAAEPDAGEPFAALDRLISLGWQHLERASAIAKAVAEELPAASRRRLHGPAFGPVHRLVARGQREGVFRTDVPAEWLVACSFGLIHAAADEVRAGHLNARSVPRLLNVSLHALFERGGAGLSKTRRQRHGLPRSSASGRRSRSRSKST